MMRVWAAPISEVGGLKGEFSFMSTARLPRGTREAPQVEYNNVVSLAYHLAIAQSVLKHFALAIGARLNAG